MIIIPQMNETLAQRIKRLRLAAKMSQQQLAEACGWKSQSRVGNYEVGTREPSLADIGAMAAALHVKESDLLLGLKPLNGGPDPDASSVSISSSDAVREMLAKHGRKLPDQVRHAILAAAETPVGPASSAAREGELIPASPSGLRVREDEVLIPQYDVRAAMGHGQVPPDYNEAIRNLIVREDVLRAKGVIYTALPALAVITGWGQSMEGTINDKDPLIVDRGVNEFIGDGLYVLTWHGLLYIKRVQVVDAEHFRLISDNQHYENQTARADDITIHAKVLLIWNMRKA